MTSESVSAQQTRIDRWLYAARIYKSRSQATQACSGGHVHLNGRSARPGNRVRVGDRIVATAPRGKTEVVVLAIAEKRLGAAPARELYEDHSPPPPPRDERPVLVRPRGSGRPSKADRRALAKLRRRG